MRTREYKALASTVIMLVLFISHLLDPNANLRHARASLPIVANLSWPRTGPITAAPEVAYSPPFEMKTAIFRGLLEERTTYNGLQELCWGPHCGSIKASYTIGFSGQCTNSTDTIKRVEYPSGWRTGAGVGLPSMSGARAGIIMNASMSISSHVPRLEYAAMALGPHGPRSMLCVLEISLRSVAGSAGSSTSLPTTFRLSSIEGNRYLAPHPTDPQSLYSIDQHNWLGLAAWMELAMTAKLYSFGLSGGVANADPVALAVYRAVCATDPHTMDSSSQSPQTLFTGLADSMSFALRTQQLQHKSMFIPSTASRESALLYSIGAAVFGFTHWNLLQYHQANPSRASL